MSLLPQNLNKIIFGFILLGGRYGVHLRMSCQRLKVDTWLYDGVRSRRSSLCRATEFWKASICEIDRGNQTFKKS